MADAPERQGLWGRRLPLTKPKPGRRLAGWQLSPAPSSPRPRGWTPPLGPAGGPGHTALG